MAGVCGRDCGSCEFREEYGCRGCLETEGHPVWGECRVVRCCHGRGLQCCEQCPSVTGCGAAHGVGWQRECWPREEEERRRYEAERQAARRAEMARKAPVLAKWLSVLFWLTILSMTIDLLGRLELGRGFEVAANLIGAAAGLAALLCYWKFSKLSGRFRLLWRLELGEQCLTVAMVLALAAGNQLRPVFAGETVEKSGLLWLAGGLSIVALIVGAVVFYHFCGAMAEQLDGEDQGLADHWRLLRKCTLGSLGALAGCILLALIIPMLGLLVLIAAVAVLAGCGIARLVLLWKSAQFFREAQSALPEDETRQALC